MKFRQHIRVYGYPDALKNVIPTTKNGAIQVDGVGAINIMSNEKYDKFVNLLNKHGIKYRKLTAKPMTRIKYLCLKGNGVNNSVRGRRYKGDILYTVESNDERELLDKRDAALAELKTLKVPYEDVCKWVCETAPKVPAKKMFTPKTPKENINRTLDEVAQEYKKLKNTVDDLKDKLSDAEREKIRKSMQEDRKARAGVLH